MENGLVLKRVFRDKFGYADSLPRFESWLVSCFNLVLQTSPSEPQYSVNEKLQFPNSSIVHPFFKFILLKIDFFSVVCWRQTLKILRGNHPR